MVLRLKLEVGKEMDVARSLMFDESVSPMSRVPLLTGGKCEKESCAVLCYVTCVCSTMRVVCYSRAGINNYQGQSFCILT